MVENARETVVVAPVEQARGLMNDDVGVIGPVEVRRGVNVFDGAE